MSYRDIGFDELLDRSGDDQQAGFAQLDPLQFEQFAPSFSASKIQGGAFTSTDGKVIFDLENNVLRITDGTQDRVTLGKLSDGSIGLAIKDQSGNILFQISGTTNVIQSASRTFKIDLTAEQLQAFETPDGIMRVLVGRQSQGF